MFNCGRIGHYASRCTYKEYYCRRPDDDNKGRDNHRWNNRNNIIDGIDKPKKNLYTMETYSSEEDDRNDSNEESLFLAIEENSNKRSGNPEDVKNGEKLENENIALHVKMEAKAWVIDFRCSNHMTCHKGKFIDFKKYDGGSAKFASEEAALICDNSTISIDGKHKTDDVYYVKRVWIRCAVRAISLYFMCPDVRSGNKV